MTKKKIWIMNHYAINMFFKQAGRHYWFAENLQKRGYEPTIFCANIRHNAEDTIDVSPGTEKVLVQNQIPFVFVKTSRYRSGLQRVQNMVSFYGNLFPAARQYAKTAGPPHCILASSVHPLTLVAGIRLAGEFGVPCICEVRDLWPETLVAYGLLTERSMMARLLYRGEKWIYKKADKLIFTMEGGKDYIREKGWDIEQGGPIDLGKVYHINNGINLEEFQENRDRLISHDPDLRDEETFKVVYAGSMGRANNVGKIIDAARHVGSRGYHHIKFFIYGRGPEREKLESYCRDHNIDNVIFKGFVDKERVPHILSSCDLNILHFGQTSLKRFGASLNKLFEYFASGRPTLSDCEFNYDLIKRYSCGVVVDNADARQLGEAVTGIYHMPPEEYQDLCRNALRAAQDYDFGVLTTRLEDLLKEQRPTCRR